MSEAKGKVTKILKDGNAIQIEGEDGYISTRFDQPHDVVVAGLKVDATVTAEYVKKGVYKNATKLTVDSQATVEAPKQETKTVTQEQKPAAFTCSDCGKELKDGKYTKCFECNKKNPVKKGKGTSYDSPEKTAQIQRGNSLNAAASAVSGNLLKADGTSYSPKELAEAVLIVANRILEWLRME